MGVGGGGYHWISHAWNNATSPRYAEEKEKIMKMTVPSISTHYILKKCVNNICQHWYCLYYMYIPKREKSGAKQYFFQECMIFTGDGFPWKKNTCDEHESSCYGKIYKYHCINLFLDVFAVGSGRVYYNVEIWIMKLNQIISFTWSSLISWCPFSFDISEYISPTNISNSCLNIVNQCTRAVFF